jgi:hypothetical protein
MKKIDAMTPCFVSKIGHNNFWYSVILEDVQEPHVKSWICDRKDLVAIEIDITKIKDLYGDPDKRTIVWVHQNDIKSD